MKWVQKVTSSEILHGRGKQFSVEVSLYIFGFIFFAASVSSSRSDCMERYLKVLHTLSVSSLSEDVWLGVTSIAGSLDFFHLPFFWGVAVDFSSSILLFLALVAIFFNLCILFLVFERKTT